jgi:molybdopterin converting factor small subunit
VSKAVPLRKPTQQREQYGGNAEVTTEGGTLAAVLDGLESSHPGFRERLFDDQGELRRFVNVFVDDEDIRFLDGVNTDVADGATVSIVPAVAGG